MSFILFLMTIRESLSRDSRSHYTTFSWFGMSTIRVTSWIVNLMAMLLIGKAWFLILYEERRSCINMTFCSKGGNSRKWKVNNLLKLFSISKDIGALIESQSTQKVDDMTKKVTFGNDIVFLKSSNIIIYISTINLTNAHAQPI